MRTLVGVAMGAQAGAYPEVLWDLKLTQFVDLFKKKNTKFKKGKKVQAPKGACAS